MAKLSDNAASKAYLAKEADKFMAEVDIRMQELALGNRAEVEALLMALIAEAWEDGYGEGFTEAY